MTSTDIQNVRHPTSLAQSSSNGTNTINVGDTERIASAVGGGALALYGLREGSLGGIALALLGGALVYRGVTGHCGVYQALGVNTAMDHNPQNVSGAKNMSTMHVEKRMTINKSPEELYTFWRNFENLPHFMKHLESVTTSDASHSHWVAKAPLGKNVAWDAEITRDEANKLIAWQSVGDADVPNTGEVRFVAAPTGRGTEVQVTIDYNPPAGAAGALVAKLFGEEPSQQVEGDLRRFKNIMEAGEIPTTEGQVSGRGHDTGTGDKK